MKWWWAGITENIGESIHRSPPSSFNNGQLRCWDCDTGDVSIWLLLLGEYSWDVCGPVNHDLNCTNQMKHSHIRDERQWIPTVTDPTKPYLQQDIETRRILPSLNMCISGAVTNGILLVIISIVCRWLVLLGIEVPINRWCSKNHITVAIDGVELLWFLGQ